MAEKKAELEKVLVKSACEGREDDPNHVAFHEVHAEHKGQVGHVRGGQIVELALTPNVKAALERGDLKRVTEKQAERAEEQAKEAASP
jgi:hypothetical protein